ncbi:MAG: lipid-binding SYLF domain-containing protein, partial [Candidatus Omnitrophica bacterium]|nr:lipid-binding SYLF domain-containing protein [Candidatus Omnitrophota bacterium]
MKRFCVCLLTFSLLCLASPAVSADNTGLDMRIDNCDDLFGDIMQMPDKGIPTDLLAKCSGVAIFPSVIKGGFIFAGRFGKGVIMHRNKKTGAWSAPAFYTIAGGSWGLQIGGQITDLVLVINNERGMKGLLQSKFTIGGDASCAAGPVGRNVEVSTDLFLKAG